MISEDQQELAALYALGALDAREADAFERELAQDPALRELTRDFRDAAASLVSGAPALPAPARLRARVLRAVAPREPANVVRMVPAWVPWAAAATLAVCCGLLAAREGYLRAEVAGMRGSARLNAAPDALAQISFCSLTPLPPGKVQPQASIAWDRSRRLGAVRLEHLDPPAAGKDYQLWVVEEGKPKPVSAGVVHVNPEGAGRAIFKPVGAGAGDAQAFALSLEDAGGVPEGKGPILLMGKL